MDAVLVQTILIQSTQLFVTQNDPHCQQKDTLIVQACFLAPCSMSLSVRDKVWMLGNMFVRSVHPIVKRVFPRTQLKNKNKQTKTQSDLHCLPRMQSLFITPNNLPHRVVYRMSAMNAARSPLQRSTTPACKVLHMHVDL